jgi:hypothetical protein
VKGLRQLIDSGGGGVERKKTMVGRDAEDMEDVVPHYQPP